MELGTIRWVAIVVVECEAENLAEPRDGLAYVGIDDVGQDGVWGNGAIFHHQKHLWVSGLIGGGHWNGNENLDFVGRKYNAEAQRAQRFAEKRGKKRLQRRHTDGSGDGLNC